MDINGIQITPIKVVVHRHSHVLTYVFNLVLKTEECPRNMETAQVIVFQKCGNVRNFSNYRPISIVPTLRKGLEKVIHPRITSFY